MRSRKRLRRLIVAVVCVDLLGAGLLVYALSRPASPTALVHKLLPVGAHHAQTETVASAVTHSAGRSGAHRRGPRLAPATSMPSPSMSRAPALRTGATGDTGNAGSVLEGNAEASFANLSSGLQSEAHITIAIQPLGQGTMEVLGGDPAMQAMSTSKVLILSALLLDKRGVNNLTSGQLSLARSAITQSDNSAILALFSDLESDRGGLVGASSYATGLLRKAGDDQTNVSTGPPPPGYATTFGQTPWTPTAEITFFRALTLGCIVPRADADYELGLMRNIVPSESFGLGAGGFPRVAFKGGWGPEPDGQYGVRQTGIVGNGDSAVVVSITADPARTFAVGQSVLDQVAQWLHREVRFTQRPKASCPT
jgi:hypothetical protein